MIQHTPTNESNRGGWQLVKFSRRTSTDKPRKLRTIYGEYQYRRRTTAGYEAKIVERLLDRYKV